MSVIKLLRDNIRELTPYSSAGRLGGQGTIWLNANESPFEPGWQYQSRALNRYPEPQPVLLRQHYAAYAGLKTAQVLISRGADEAIALLIQAFCEPGRDRIGISSPTYGMYAISARIAGVEVCDIPLQPQDWSLDMAALKAALPQLRILFVCSPHNPLGLTVAPDQLAELAEAGRDNCLIVVDEAYMEFAGKSAVSLLQQYDNLVILRTLSKAFGLAALRCGFVLADSELIDKLSGVIAPYPIPGPCADIAVQALSTRGIALMQTQVAQLNALRQQLVRHIATCRTIEQVADSQANFVLVRVANKASLLTLLQTSGIVVRDQSAQPGLDNCLRLTIGDARQQQQLVRLLKQYDQQENRS